MLRRDVIAALPDHVIVEEMICDGAELVVLLLLRWPTTTVSLTSGFGVVLDADVVNHDPRMAWRMKQRLLDELLAEEAAKPLDIPPLAEGW